ncbi:2Fe-2S iron-sulfur cluster-binding protein [Streptomyces sp. NPDC058735]|uniref:2Fe-2S iron-sulfur cluster-binding protein n=1 Tax=Streptomyces sp. NPDC058735 TaxID=3346616 RepID=UPI0036C7AB7A
MTDDQHGEGTPRGAGRWDPLPQGEYDDGATAFVELPEGGVDALLAADSPLAAPGHGYVPPQITVGTATTAGTDPAATGAWQVPGAPVDDAQWHDPHAAHQQQAQDAQEQSYGTSHAPYGTPYGSGAQAGQHGGNDRFTYNPGATGQWNFEETSAAQAAPGHDVTGQWSIPVAGGDLPDESGEFTTSSLVEQWGGTPPATLPGGAAAPWAPQAAGQPWARQTPQDAAGPEQAGPAHPYGHDQGGRPGAGQDHGSERYGHPEGHGHGHGYEHEQREAAGPATGYAPDRTAHHPGAPAQHPAGPMPQESRQVPAGHLPHETEPGGPGQPTDGHTPGEPDYFGHSAAHSARHSLPGHAPEHPGSVPGPQPAGFADAEAPERPGTPVPGPQPDGFDGHGTERPGYDGHGSRPSSDEAPHAPGQPGQPGQPEPAGDQAGHPGSAPRLPQYAEARHAEVRPGEHTPHEDHAGYPGPVSTPQPYPVAPEGSGPEPDAEAALPPRSGHDASQAAPGPGEPGEDAPEATEGPEDPSEPSEPSEPPSGKPAESSSEPSGESLEDLEDPMDAETASEPDAADGETPGAGEEPAAESPVTEGADAEGAPDETDVAEAPDAPATAPQEEHPLASFVLRVNDAERPVADAWIGESLLYVLRERLGLAGAKDGCSQGECGACNVQVDGRLVASCLVPAVTAAGSEVRTVEGLAEDGQPSDVQRALARCGAVQCGFCIPGMAMTVHDLLEGNPAPTELETRQALCGNLCRCSGYRGVLEAVKEVVAERGAHGAPAEGDSEARIPHQAGPGAGGVNASAFGSPPEPHGPEPHSAPHDQSSHDQSLHDQSPDDQSPGQDGGQA